MHTDRLDFQSTHLQFDDLQNIDKLHELITINYLPTSEWNFGAYVRTKNLSVCTQQRTQQASEQVI
jgi:hypothetical protein